MTCSQIRTAARRLRFASPRTARSERITLILALREAGHPCPGVLLTDDARQTTRNVLSWINRQEATR